MLKSGALPLRRSSKSQPFQLYWQNSQCKWVPSPLLHEKQQNGAVPPQIWELQKYSTFLGGHPWPQTSLNLYPGREDMSTLINTYCPIAEATEYYWTEDSCY